MTGPVFLLCELSAELNTDSHFYNLGKTTGFCGKINIYMRTVKIIWGLWFLRLFFYFCSETRVLKPDCFGNLYENLLCIVSK